MKLLKKLIGETLPRDFVQFDAISVKHSESAQKGPRHCERSVKKSVNIPQCVRTSQEVGINDEEQEQPSQQPLISELNLMCSLLPSTSKTLTSGAFLDTAERDSMSEHLPKKLKY